MSSPFPIKTTVSSQATLTSLLPVAEDDFRKYFVKLCYVSEKGHPLHDKEKNVIFINKDKRVTEIIQGMTFK